MNPIALVAILCLAYSVADECKISSEIMYKLFTNFEQSQKEELRKLFNKTADHDLVLYYEMTDSSAPSVIISRTPKTRANYFIYKRSGVKKSNMTEFAKNLNDCKSMFESEDYHISEILKGMNEW